MRAVAIALCVALAAGQYADTFAHYEASVVSNVNPTVISEFAAMDIEGEMKAAADVWQNEKVLVVGKIHNVSRDFFELAHRTKHENGTIYTAAWRIPNAFSLAVHFDKFDVPEGGALWVMTDTEIGGPWTHETRWDAGNLMTRHLDGNMVTVLYFQSHQAKRHAAINVDVVTGAFQPIGMNAGVCNIQAICIEPSNTCNPGCDPTDRGCSVRCTFIDQTVGNGQWAAIDWEAEQWATVAMANAAGSRFCSGSFINNKAGRPLVLTAAHCNVGTSTLVHRKWRNPTCASPDNRGGSFEAAGNVQVVAREAQSDMTVISVGDARLPRGDVYLAGWEAGDESNPAQNVVGLHHPRASNMKISHGGSVRPARWTGTGPPWTHWRIDAWTEATTEPGSSGSPMFNRQTKRIIGQLHGGSAACPAQNGWDSYGAVWRSYQANQAMRTALTNDDGTLGLDGAWWE